MENLKSPWKLYAEQVSAAAEIVDSYYREQNLLEPTAGYTQSVSLSLPPSAPQDILVARQTVIDSASKLQQLAIGPNEYLPYLALQVRPSLRGQNHISSAPTQFRPSILGEVVKS